MKSHPDAASRSAAEVVTQLPVPSRLGMLRFERLNEPSWSLLFLDPACERQLGVSAGELCALLDCPYASLMEPEARYQLHDDIQRQLASTQHYSVRYRLHTPNGALHLLEIGESFQQRGRFLLRGYLLVTAEAGENLAEQRLQELEEQNSKLQTSLELYQHSQEEHLQHLIRSRAQQSLIVRLARHRYSALDPLKEAAELITQAACETYDVARASIWHLIGDHLEPVAMYRRDIDRHELPAPMDASRFPRYLDALHSGRAIDAHNAQRDPRTSELTRAYLKPLGISALLDASIRLGGEVVAVLCLEHIGPARTWQADEIAFAGELADQFAQVMSNQQRRDATSALFLFQRAVEQSANAFLLFDRDGLVQYVNPSFTAITQYGAEEVQGRRISQLPALENLGDLLFDAQTGLAERNSWQGEFRSRRKNLEPYWGQLSISKVYNDDGELTHYIGIYEDITQSKLAQQRIERLAYSDNLTGLGNRPYFIRCLEERFARRDSQAFSLLLVDIDNFKRINDSLGHPTGDKLLVSLAKRLRNTLGPAHLLARLASNEFAVVLDGADISGNVTSCEYSQSLGLIVGLAYLEWNRRKALAAQEGYGTDLINEPAPFENEQLAHPVIAILPLVLVGVMNKVFTMVIPALYGDSVSFAPAVIGKVAPVVQQTKAIMAIWAVEGALLVGIATVFVFAGRIVIQKFAEGSKNAIAGALLATMNTASEYGFGAVIAALPGFLVVAQALGSIPNPLVNEAVTVTALAGITGSASGGMSIALAAMAETFIANAQAAGIPLEVFHRVASMASGGMDTLPHNGAVITLLAVTGLTHRQSYKDIFAITVIKTAAVFFVIAMYYATGLV